MTKNNKHEEVTVVQIAGMTKVLKAMGQYLNITTQVGATSPIQCTW